MSYLVQRVFWFKKAKEKNEIKDYRTYPTCNVSFYVDPRINYGFRRQNIINSHLEHTRIFIVNGIVVIKYIFIKLSNPSRFLWYIKVSEHVNCIQNKYSWILYVQNVSLILIKLYSMSLKTMNKFKMPWNVMDLLVLALSLEY